MPSSPVSNDFDWATIAALVTAAVTGLISIYNFISLLEMRASRRVASEAKLEVVGVGNRLSVSLEPRAATPISVEQSCDFEADAVSSVLLSVINISGGPAYDVRVDIQIERANIREDIASQKIGNVRITIDAATLVVEEGEIRQVASALWRTSMRMAAMPGNSTNAVALDIDKSLAVGLIATHISLDSQTGFSARRNLHLIATLRYRDISHKLVEKQKKIALNHLSTSQKVAGVKFTYEVSAIFES